MLVPPAVVTVTSTVPEPGGLVAVIDVALLTENVAAASAWRVTAVSPPKLVRVIVTDVPAAEGPGAGASGVSAGPGGGALSAHGACALGARVPPGLVTVMPSVPSTGPAALVGTIR